MIDTLRFQIPVSHEVRSQIERRSDEIITNNRKNKSIFIIHKKDIQIQSYDYHIHFILTDTGTVFLEFSAPKVYYGHNIYLLYPKDLGDALQKVRDLIQEEFCINFPDYKKWLLQRLDICYAWRFPSQQDAYIGKILLENYEFSRKKRNIYDTGVKYIGASYDLKVYMKHDEFKIHDYKKIFKLNNEWANYLLDHSQGILRIEATLRKEQLVYLFGDKIKICDIEETETLLEILNTYFFKMIKSADTNTISYKNVVERILKTYSARRAWSLIDFYNFYFSPNTTYRNINRRLLKDKRHRSTISRKLKLLNEAQIGIPDFTTKLLFDFKIPSKNVVNSETDPVALATDQLFDYKANKRLELEVKGGEADLDETAL